MPHYNGKAPPAECALIAGTVESEHADFPGTASPAWRILDGGSAGTAVLCTVGPQHQTCRTWLGTTGGGIPAAVVTDLGLLGIDLETEPVLPWEPIGQLGQSRVHKRIMTLADPQQQNAEDRT